MRFLLKGSCLKKGRENILSRLFAQTMVNDPTNCITLVQTWSTVVIEITTALESPSMTSLAPSMVNPSYCNIFI